MPCPHADLEDDVPLGMAAGPPTDHYEEISAGGALKKTPKGARVLRIARYLIRTI